MSPISLVSTVIIARHLVLMAKAMVAVSLASSLLLLLVVGGAVGLGNGGQAWGEGWEDMRQEVVEAEVLRTEGVLDFVKHSTRASDHHSSSTNCATSSRWRRWRAR